MLDLMYLLHLLQLVLLSWQHMSVCKVMRQSGQMPTHRLDLCWTTQSGHYSWYAHQ